MILEPYVPPRIPHTLGLPLAVVWHWQDSARELASQPPGSPLRWRRHDGRVVFCRNVAELATERQADLVTFRQKLEDLNDD